MVIGILAHVDAGKTTLSEALLYETGQIRALGRVDHKDAYLDTNSLERERGITIFSKQARIIDGDFEVTLLDTPGHVDFSAEMERTLMVLDYAILVISGTDGVQGHTRTLWRLLRHYKIPTILFINKMDLDGANQTKLMAELKKELSDGCIDFSNAGDDAWMEEVAMTKEDLLDQYMESAAVDNNLIRDAIQERFVFPCYFGSALKLEGVTEFWEGIKDYTKQKVYPNEFSARVYKIARDAKGVRLTYLKVTGGTLHVKERISYNDLEEKIDQIRKYSGEKYELAEMVSAGEVCAVTGLTQTIPGGGLGACEVQEAPILEPVLNYQILLPNDVNPAEMYLKLKQLEEEDPQLYLVWKEEVGEIHAQMMGQVQMEVLGRIIKERFGVVVTFGPGSIVYKETIAKPIEGVGHFEPLRHYAEVHLLLEPGEPGSGISVSSACSEDILDLNWQRLIATHVEEREHPGVLTGSSVTDMKVTILTGRAHLKHTEGGDFRQATYRAIRQGLKSTENILLEPYYAFTLQIPMEQVGRAMTDLEQRFATMDAPEFFNENGNETACIRGRAPVATMQDYISEVHAYTSGKGHLLLELSGYDVCHNADEVIARIGYDSEEDTANPTASVFCAHGAGYLVPWNEVPKHMHLAFVYQGDAENNTQMDGFSYDNRNAMTATTKANRKSWEEKVTAMTSCELDAELAEVYAREFGMSKSDMEEQERRKWAKKRTETSKPNTVKYDKKGNPIYPAKGPQEEYLLVDGYNIIFAWDDLKELASINIDSARDKLKDILSNYQGYRKCHVLVVFDAYKKKGNPGTSETYHNIEVVYTKQDETADMYIEKKVHEISKKYRVTVATSDGLEQLTAMSMGALRMSAHQLQEEIERLSRLEYEEYQRKKENNYDSIRKNV